MPICASTVNDGVMDPYGNENTASVPLVHHGGDLLETQGITHLIVSKDP